MSLEWDGLLDIMFISGGDTPNINETVLNKYREARRVALAGGYDALLTVEDDMVVPHDGLQKLWSVNADIIYGLYCMRHGTPVWSAYVSLTPSGGRSISRDENAAKAAWGDIIDVAGVGNGFTLIRRNVLEAFDFRTEGATAPDWWLAVDAQRRGFTQKCHCGVICGHIATENRARILWPDIEHKNLCRVVPL